MKLRIWVLLGAAFGMAIPIVLIAFKSPSHDSNWKSEYAVLPKAEFAGDSVTIRNVRNFSYTDDGAIRKASYYDETYDISTLTNIWYGISHFYGYGFAHTFLSFEFEGDKYLTISVEARLKIGQSYSPIAGLFRKYELIYVIGDERDIIGLRTQIRSERVYLYKIIVEKQAATEVFLAMLNSVNEIYERPRFYNTLTDNCTTNLLKYSKKLSWFDRLFNYKIILPGYSDELAYGLGIIANDRPLAHMRQQARINPNGIEIGDPHFSLRIRQP